MIFIPYNVPSGGNSPDFTIEVRHGGKFYDKLNNLVYENEFILFLEFFHDAWFTKDNLEKFLHAVGDKTLL